MRTPRRLAAAEIADKPLAENEKSAFWLRFVIAVANGEDGTPLPRASRNGCIAHRARRVTTTAAAGAARGDLRERRRAIRG